VLAAVCINTMMWLLVGDSLAASGGSMLIGHTWFTLARPTPAIDYAQLVFQIARVVVMTGIVSGSVSERIDLRAYLAIVCTCSGIIFPIISRSVWYDYGA